MNKKIKWIIAVFMAAVLMVGVYFLYNYLTNDYKPQNTVSDNERIDVPDFTVLDYNGNEVKLSDYFGKPIVLNFWATWCYYCTEEMPDFNKIAKKDDDIVFLMVNVTDGVRETVDKAKNYIEKNGYEFDVVFDTKYEASKYFGVASLPMTFFIDKDGKLVTYARGGINEEILLQCIKMIK